MITNNEPTEGDLLKKAETLARCQQTLTLATAENAEAWAAPLYYWFRGWRFYFFSTPQSRHIREALSSGQTAGTVFYQGDGWRSIQGLQMSGTLVPVEGKRESAGVLMGYFRKFPFTGDFFTADGKLPNLTRFQEQFKVKLYAFSPSRVRYLDNRLGFGFRAEIQLPGLPPSPS